MSSQSPCQADNSQGRWKVGMLVMNYLFPVFK